MGLPVRSEGGTGVRSFRPTGRSPHVAQAGVLQRARLARERKLQSDEVRQSLVNDGVLVLAIRQPEDRRDGHTLPVTSEKRVAPRFRQPAMTRIAVQELDVSVASMELAIVQGRGKTSR